MKKLFLYGACALLAFGAASCHGDDPLAEGNAAPVVKPAVKSVSGVVTDQDGNPIEGATVVMGDKTTKTNKNGEYTFNDVEGGEHTVTVSIDGYNTSSRDINMPNDTEGSSSVTCSFTLYPRVVGTLAYSKDATTTSFASVTSTHVIRNTEGSVKMSVEVEEGTCDEDVNIYVTPIYTENSKDIMATKAAKEEMLIGAYVWADKPNVEIKKDIKIRFELDNSATGVVNAKELNGENWQGVASNVDGNDVVIATRKFTSFGLFASVDVTETRAQRKLTLSADYWDNVTGTAPITISDVTYKYNSGAKIATTASNKLQGLLIEFVAKQFGASEKTIDGTWAIDTTVNPGYGLQAWGYQYYWNMTATCSTVQVKATRWGDLTFGTRSWNQDHMGGGSL